MTKYWFLNGIRRRILTEKDLSAYKNPGLLWPSRIEGHGEVSCPVDAISSGGWNSEKCIFCRRCIPSYTPTGDQDIYETEKSDPVFRKSFHIFLVDSGTCGACNTEINSIFAPQYDANRLGIFVTNTPRDADAIVVMGVYTEKMQEPLKRAIEAVPKPAMVIGLGTCALSGGILGKNPLDREVYFTRISGCPPSPYTIIRALEEMRNRRRDGR